ncbi:hypothetical protein H5410_022525 [Solanum commersonii]|uniref:Uncharacterized protein n=1 Tax=Solanum commersonii TaxID=4109 RepID=A0A9J5ZI58_SOLCO|nr:hypothetical protein H5410_022525 [Solanum commersonii]
MDGEGVHSQRMQKILVSDNKDLTSQDQAVAVKTHQTRLWVTLPKSEGEGSSSSAVTRIIYCEGQDKHVITPPNPGSKRRQTSTDIEAKQT